MCTCAQYLVLFISVSCFRPAITNNISRRFQEDFKGVDSDFDLEKAVENFKAEDYENITQDFMSYLDLSPKSQDKNISSAEITKLLKIGESLLDTSSERKLEKMRHSIRKKDKEELRLRNTTKSIENKTKGNKRVKRQGKFQEAANTDNLKVLRIYLTMFKNLYAHSSTGGGHPLHPEVPKSVVFLFKRRIMEFFFPPIGDEKKTANG